MVLQGALGLVCAGLAIGAPLAIASKGLASRLVADLPPDTAWPIALATAAMVGVALVAAYLPARRAARVQPVDALRHS